MGEQTVSFWQRTNSNTVFSLLEFWEVCLLELCLGVITATWSSFVDMLINLWYFYFCCLKKGPFETLVSQTYSTIWQLTRPQAAAFLLSRPLQSGVSVRVGVHRRDVTAFCPRLNLS